MSNNFITIQFLTIADFIDYATIETPHETPSGKLKTVSVVHVQPTRETHPAQNLPLATITEAIRITAETIYSEAILSCYIPTSRYQIIDHHTQKATDEQLAAQNKSNKMLEEVKQRLLDAGLKIRPGIITVGQPTEKYSATI
ncbi:MAG: hypothetical protein KDD89_06485 [Anaerolineales bacterium]|nr:hypothetical protein [Anaerolineales bacterium]